MIPIQMESSCFKRSVFTRENTSNSYPINIISFTTAEIQSLLSDIDPNKAQGPDKIAPFILKNCALPPIFEQ